MDHMTKKSSLLLGAALSLILVTPVIAQDTGAETQAPATEAAEVSADMVIATVNGEEITLGHLIAARYALPEQYQTLPDEVLFNGLIEQLIQQTVLGQSLSEVSRRAEIQLENERRAIIATEKLDQVITSAVDEDKVAAAYEADYANAEPTREWNASHILVETEEEAQALVDELAGGADFATLAQEKSTGPSGPSGGELGWFSPGMMVQPFEDAVTGMQAGEVAGPVQTQFGWHVIKLNEERMKAAPALEEVRGEITDKLQSEAVEAALAALTEAATIDRADVEGIDPSVLSNPSLLD